MPPGTKNTKVVLASLFETNVRIRIEIEEGNTRESSSVGLDANACLRNWIRLAFGTQRLSDGLGLARGLEFDTWFGHIK